MVKLNTSLVLPSFVWQFSPSTERTGSHLPSVFAHWHRASLLELSLAELSVDGEKIAAPDLERLNLWISASGAWRCSALPYWDCRTILDEVLRSPYPIPVGKSGAGRWTSRPKLEEVLRDRGKRVQGELLF